MAHTRRDFLRLGSAFAARAAVPAGLAAPLVLRPTQAQAMTEWGNLLNGVPPLPGGPYKVLELFLPGGLSIWENFWVTRNGSTPDWRGFDAEMAKTEWLCPANVSDRPDATGITEFGDDEDGNRIFWGPATQPLWRNDIFSRARMVVQSHGLDPHEAAAPMAITGTILGSPRHATLGAAFARRQEALGLVRPQPWAYTLSPSNLSTFRFVENAAVATGMHGGQYRPLLIRLANGNNQAFLNNLERPGLSTALRADDDALLNAYIGAYRDMLRHHELGDPIRSSAFDQYEASVSALQDAPNFTNLFGNGVLTVNTDDFCVRETGNAAQQSGTNHTQAGLATAAGLLSHPTTPAQHVTVIDGGLNRFAGAPYDTHNSQVTNNMDHILSTSANLYNALSSLAAVIGTGPGQINLDDTLVLITTEFSREPNRGSNNDNGREHHTSGYATVLIGGPVTSRGIAGAINASGSAVSGKRFGQADIRGATLLAGGISPFEPQLFGTSDFTAGRIDVGDEIDNSINLMTEILGVTP